MTDHGGKRNFDLLDDLRYARIGTSRISPDGMSVVCDLTRNDLDNNLTYTDLWLIDLDSGETRQLTYGPGIRITLRHGRRTVLELPSVSDRNGKQQVYLLPVAGGEAQQFTDLKQGVGSQPQWSPDGKTDRLYRGY